VKRWLLPLFLLGISGLLWGDVTPAAACTCAGLTPQEYAANSNVVLVGTLVGVRYDPALTTTYSENRLTLIDVRVDRYLKGFGPDSLTISDPGHTVIEARDGMPWSVVVSCSVFDDRAVGSRYLLFLDGTDPPTSADFCGGSTELDNPGPPAAEYLAMVERILGANALPSSGGSLVKSSQGFGTSTVLVGALASVGALAFLVGAAFVWRRGEPHNG
jgi:hypothetical protein